MSFAQYKEFIIDFLELLSPDLVVERFCGEVPPRYHSQYNWGSLRNEYLVQSIEQRMIERNTWQGRLYKDDRAKNLK